MTPPVQPSSLPRSSGGDDDLRLGVGQDVPDLVRSLQEYHRHDDAARLEDGRVGLQHLGAIGEQDDDAVSGVDAEPPEGVGEAVGGALLLT
jgi:hypothetical protein